jgi:hypothetical protein
MQNNDINFFKKMIWQKMATKHMRSGDGSLFPLTTKQIENGKRSFWWQATPLSRLKCNEP